MPEEKTQNNSKGLSISVLTSQSITNFEPVVQLAVQALADDVDVTEMDKVNSYAGGPQDKAISELMSFLEKMKGTEEDKQAVKSIAELSAKVNTEINDIKIVPKEMGFFEKLFARFKGDPQENVFKKIDSCHTLLNKLMEHMIREIELLAQRQDDADNIICSHVEIAEKLEQFLVAGYIAIDRIESEVQSAYGSSLMIRQQVDLKKKEDGLDIFKITLSNLEKTRYATFVALLQTMGNKTALEKLENNFKSTMRNLLLIFAQQATITMLGNTVRNAIDSHNTITKLDSEIMKGNSENLKKNLEDVSKLMVKGVADIATMKKCAEIIIEGAENHNKIITEYVDNLGQQSKEIEEALEPIRKFMSEDTFETEKSKDFSSSSSLTAGTTELKF